MSGEKSGNDDRTTKVRKKQNMNNGANGWIHAMASRSMSTTVQKALMIRDHIHTMYPMDDKPHTEKGYWEWLWGSSGAVSRPCDTL